MKKIEFNKLLPEKGTVRVLISTLLLTVGIYFAYPVRGVVASFPLCYLFSALAFFVFPKLSVHLIAAVAIAFFYAMMTGFTDPFTFGAFAFLSSLCGALTVKCLRGIRQGKKWLLSLCFFLIAAAGILLPLLFCGTPSAYLAAKEDARTYLSEHYPQQRFSSLLLFHDLRKGGYEAEVAYEYEGNLLTSRIFFGDEVEDGFLKDFALWMQEKRKSVMIGILNETDANLVIDSAGLAEKTQDGIFHGSYGTVGKEMEPLFHFSATFREEKPERRDFAEAIRAVMQTLHEADFDYGSITFHALDAGNVVYECTVTSETDPETVLSLVKYAR